MSSRVLSQLILKAVRPFAGAIAFILFSLLSGSAQITVSEVQWPGTAEYYARAIARGTAEVKRTVLHKIRSHQSERASELALPALKDRDPMIRATAASAIAWLPGDRAFAALIPLLRDRDEFVRREAAYALGIAGTASGVPHLSRLLANDRDLEVRAAAAIALGGMGDLGGVPALLAAINAKRSEENEFLRSMSARSLGQIAIYIRSGERIEVVPQNFLPVKYKLSLLDKPAASMDPAVSRRLLSILRDEREHLNLRRHAAFALGAIGSASFKAALAPFAQCDDPYMSEIAREAVLMLEDPTAGI